MPRQKSNKGVSSVPQKKGKGAYSSHGSGKSKVSGKNMTAVKAAKQTTASAIRTAIVKGTQNAHVKGDLPAYVSVTVGDRQVTAVVPTLSEKRKKTDPAVTEIAEKLKDRELFSEKVKRAKAILKNLKPLPV